MIGIEITLNNVRLKLKDKMCDGCISRMLAISILIADLCNRSFNVIHNLFIHGYRFFVVDFQSDNDLFAWLTGELRIVPVDLIYAPWNEGLEDKRLLTHPRFDGMIRQTMGDALTDNVFIMSIATPTRIYCVASCVLEGGYCWVRDYRN